MAEQGKGAPGRSRRRRTALVAVSAAILVFAAVTARFLIWPPLGPLPARADAIVELAGTSDGGRDALTLALARSGRARYMVQSTEAGDARCLPSVPGVTVVCFHPDPLTTRGEAQAIGRMARQYGWSSVILVTTPDQALRATLRTSRCFPGAIYNATAPLATTAWVGAIPYQWGAFVKAFTVETEC